MLPLLLLRWLLLLLLVLAVCTGNPPNPADGTFNCPSSAPPGSMCNATCNVGYAGMPSATCQPNGTYSDVLGVCIQDCKYYSLLLLSKSTAEHHNSNVVASFLLQ